MYQNNFKPRTNQNQDTRVSRPGTARPATSQHNRMSRPGTSTPAPAQRPFVPRPFNIEPVEPPVEKQIPSRLAAKDKHHKAGYSEGVEEDRHSRISFKKYLEDHQSGNTMDDDQDDDHCIHIDTFIESLDTMVSNIGNLSDDEADDIIAFLGSKAVINNDDIAEAAEYAGVDRAKLMYITKNAR